MAAAAGKAKVAPRLKHVGVKQQRFRAQGLKYSKWIESPDQHEDRKGQSLATRNHDVIRLWAKERDAVPSTVKSTEREGQAGILRLNFPGYGEGRILKK